jgi:hypothetical protein
MNGRTAFEAFRAVWLERGSVQAPTWEGLSSHDVRAWEAVAKAVTPSGERQAAMEMQQKVNEMRHEAHKAQLAVEDARYDAALFKKKFHNSQNSLAQEISRNAQLVAKVERLELFLKDYKEKLSKINAPRESRQTCQRSSVRHVYFLQPEDIFRQSGDQIAEASLAAENQEQRAAIAAVLEGPPYAQYVHSYGRKRKRASAQKIIVP